MTRFDPFQDKGIPDQALDEYLQLCHEIYLQMKKEGTWLWADSQNSEDLLESEDT
jgi:hypothetical protein